MSKRRRSKPQLTNAAGERISRKDKFPSKPVKGGGWEDSLAQKEEMLARKYPRRYPLIAKRLGLL